MEPLYCKEENAAQFLEWIRTRGGLRVWYIADLSDPGWSATTPAQNADGSPKCKPYWKAAEEPARHITSADDVQVFTSKEVKRFHVAVRRSSNGLMMKCTDASSERIRKALARTSEKYGKSAYYAFDYITQECVIMVDDTSITLTEWAKQHEPQKGGD